jgi:hypothetical protein
LLDAFALVPAYLRDVQDSASLGYNGVLPWRSDQGLELTGSILESWGFDIILIPVTEFLKTGGAVHCLALDIGDESIIQVNQEIEFNRYQKFLKRHAICEQDHTRPW